MALRQRARKEEEKQARRDAILEVASKLLAREQFATITMAAMARRCGLAKGTLYLYFKSKEELFLAALERELAAWFDELALEVMQTAAWDAQRFGEAVARSLGKREPLADLLTILHTVLERNIEVATAIAFKQMLRDKVVAGGQVVEQALSGLHPGDGARLLLRVHALIVGLRQMSDPSPLVDQVLAREEFATLRVDFGADLAGTIADLVRGMQRAH